MRSIIRPLRSAAGLIALVLLVYACGGDDPAGPNNDDEPAPTPTFVVTVVVSGDGEGTVTSSPAGISCTKADGTCTGTFDQGTSLTLTAAAGTDSEFATWGGSCNGSGGCSLNVTAAAEITAEFDDPAVETMTLGAAGGSISSPDGSVQLTIPAGALSGDLDITVRPVPVADIDAAFADIGPSATAAFELGPSGTTFAQPITVEWRVSDPGGSSSDIDGMLLATLKDGALELLAGVATRRVGDERVVTGLLDHFTPLVVHDVALSGRVIGAPSTAVVDEPFTVTIEGDDRTTRTAENVQWQDASTAPVSVTGGVNVSLPFIETTDPDNDPTNVFRAEVEYVCSAVGPGAIMGSVFFDPTASFAFGGIIVGPISATVDCQAIPTFRLSITKSGTGTGGVSSSPGDIACGSVCEDDYDRGTVVTLTAAPDAGSTFCGWTSGSNTEAAATITVTMSVSATVDACFNAVPVPTEVVLDPGSVTSSNGVVAGGTQTVNLKDENGDVVGSIPVEFTPPTFVGSNPARFGLGQNGSFALNFLGANMPGGFPALGSLLLRICGVNNSVQSDIQVDRRDASGATIDVVTLALLNTCVVIAAVQLVKLVMITNAFFDLSMTIVRPSSSQTEVPGGPPPELLLGG